MEPDQPIKTQDQTPTFQGMLAFQHRHASPRCCRITRALFCFTPSGIMSRMSWRTAALKLSKIYTHLLTLSLHFPEKTRKNGELRKARNPRNPPQLQIKVRLDSLLGDRLGHALRVTTLELTRQQIAQPALEKRGDTWKRIRESTIITTSFAYQQRQSTHLNQKSNTKRLSSAVELEKPQKSDSNLWGRRARLSIQAPRIHIRGPFRRVPCWSGSRSDASDPCTCAPEQFMHYISQKHQRHQSESGVIREDKAYHDHDKSYLSHQLVLVTVHSSQLSDVRKNVLQSISQLIGVHVVQPKRVILKYIWYVFIGWKGQPSTFDQIHNIATTTTTK